MDPFGPNVVYGDDTRNTSSDPFATESKSNWPPRNYRSSNDTLMDEEPASVDRSVAVAHKQSHNDFWSLPDDTFAGLSQQQSHKTQKKLELPTLSHSLNVYSEQSQPLQNLPAYFDTCHSFYSTSQHQLLLQDISIALSKDSQVDHDFSKRENKITGKVYGTSGESSWSASVFSNQVKQCIVVEMRCTFGCPFLFNDFFTRISSNEHVKQHITEFCGQPPQPIPSLLDLDLPDLPMGDFGDDDMFHFNPAEEVERCVLLLESEFLDDQRDGAQALLVMSRDDQQVDALCGIVGVLARKNMVQSADVSIARRACETLENVCKVESAAVRMQVGQNLMEQVMLVLDCPETLSTRKCKRHLVAALEYVTLSFTELPEKLLSLLHVFPKHAEFGASISKTLSQCGRAVDTVPQAQSLNDLW